MAAKKQQNIHGVSSAFKSPVSVKCDSSKTDIQTKINALKLQLNQINQEIQSLKVSYSLEDLDKYIQELHEYNEMKDIGQMLLGRLAQLQEVTTKELYTKYGLELTD